MGCYYLDESFDLNFRKVLVNRVGFYQLTRALKQTVQEVTVAALCLLKQFEDPV
jgi:hypothetical protein